jgi:lipopolysaccharide transport system permease protein
MSALDEHNYAAPQARQHAGTQGPVVIAPTRGFAALRLRELWEYRELLYFFVWRDVKVRYKQTQLGVAWAIVPPFVTMLVFTFVFGNLAKIDTGSIPYPIFSYAGLLPWQLFSLALGAAANSLVNNANLLRKVYFPRLALPIASVLGGLVDFGIAFVILLGMMWYYHIVPSAAVVALPGLLALTLITAMGVSLWLAALNVRYRDIRYVVPFLTQLWMFATPVAYPSQLLGEPWRTIYALNPMVGVVEGFRWALLGAEPPGALVWIAAMIASAVLVSGLLYFRRVERTFADLV